MESTAFIYTCLPRPLLSTSSTSYFLPLLFYSFLLLLHLLFITHSLVFLHFIFSHFHYPTSLNFIPLIHFITNYSSSLSTPIYSPPPPPTPPPSPPPISASPLAVAAAWSQRRRSYGGSRHLKTGTETLHSYPSENALNRQHILSLSAQELVDMLKNSSNSQEQADLLHCMHSQL